MKKILFISFLVVLGLIISSCNSIVQKDYSSLKGYWINKTNIYSFTNNDYYRVNINEDQISGKYFKYDIFQEEYEEYDLKGSVEDNTVNFYYEYYSNDNKVKMSYSGELSNNKITGTVKQIVNTVEVMNGSFISDFFGNEVYAELDINLNYTEVDPTLSQSKENQKVYLRKIDENEATEYQLTNDKATIKIEEFSEYKLVIDTGKDFENYNNEIYLSFPKKYNYDIDVEYNWGVVFVKVNDLSDWDEAYLEYIYYGSNYRTIKKIDITENEQKCYIPADTYYDITLILSNDSGSMYSTSRNESLDPQEIIYMGNW